MVEAIRELLTHMERLGGLPDVTEGRRPTGITAASAIIALQEKAKQKFQHPVRNLEGFLSNMGNGVVAGMEQYYREPKKYYGYDDMGNPELLKYGGSEEISPALLLFDGKHRIRVRAASTLEVSRYALEERYMQLYGMGLISDEDFIDALEIPGKERIKQDLQQRKMLAQLEAEIAESPPGETVSAGVGAPVQAPRMPQGASDGNGKVRTPQSSQSRLNSATKRTQGMRKEANSRGGGGG
ncbi:unnamed protein product [marine sediment metagenome]|uniref:Uncharacterized protein n=1 Tax=marine sediment metagenome TaxID=412755 RepID=X0VIS9_9ZZZZ